VGPRVSVRGAGCYRSTEIAGGPFDVVRAYFGQAELGI
jgi:hypothetical protein